MGEYIEFITTIRADITNWPASSSSRVSYVLLENIYDEPTSRSNDNRCEFHLRETFSWPIYSYRQEYDFAELVGRIK